MDEPTAALRRRGDRPAARDRPLARRRRARRCCWSRTSCARCWSSPTTVTVMRDGRMVRTAPAADGDRGLAIQGMLGRPLRAAYPPKRRAAPKRRGPHRARSRAPRRRRALLRRPRRARSSALAGLVGAGRTELARAIFGAQRLRGAVDAGGRRAVGRPAARLRRGLAMIPESRKEHGLLSAARSTENVSLSSLSRTQPLGFVRRASTGAPRGARRAARAGARPARRVGTLSGGNQQKVLFARMLMCSPKVLIADEPTRGVDVGAKRAIYDLIVGARRAGHGGAADLLRARGGARARPPRARDARGADRQAS